jgi:ribonuclease D
MILYTAPVMPAPPPLPTANLPLISNAAQLDEACAALGEAPLLALDTEFMRTNTYAPQLCLSQVATRSEVWCVDELASFDSEPLWQSIAASGALCVLHAAKQDLEVIRIRHRIMLPSLFDTQVAAALVGHPPQVGYGNLVKAVLGIELDKAHTRADWARRPLGSELLRYAAEDVIHLPDLHDALAGALSAAGRLDWALEDSRALLDPALYEVRPDEAWRRLAGLPFLAPEAQVRARRLAAWRETLAASRDRPRQWILSDKSILDIARRAPESLAALADCEEIAPGTVRHKGQAILAELAAAGSDDGIPPLTPDPPDQAEVKRLAKVVSGIAAELGIAPELLATRRDLIALLRGERAGRPLAGWRREVVGDALVSAL